MWIVASRNRPHLVERIFSKVQTTAPGIIAIDDDQEGLYANVHLPANWKIVSSPRGFNVAKYNDTFARFPNEPWYGKMDDDMVPETEGWDTTLVEAAGSWGFAWADDCLYGRAVCGVFGGELIRCLGYINCPAVLHFYADDGHELMAKELGNGVHRLDVKVAHLHVSAGKAPRDETYAARPNIEDDRIKWEKWKADEWPAIRERVRVAMPSR
jgi:hypothetical protein